MKIIIALFGLYLLIEIIARIFATRVRNILIAIVSIIGIAIGMVILVEKGIADKDSALNYMFLILFLCLLFIWLLVYMFFYIIKQINLKKPLKNEKYGRCINCMSPDIFLVETYHIRKDNKTVFYYTCNDCSESFTNYERDVGKRWRKLIDN